MHVVIVFGRLCGYMGNVCWKLKRSVIRLLLRTLSTEYYEKLFKLAMYDDSYHVRM